jgi:hypothetical protein
MAQWLYSSLVSATEYFLADIFARATSGFCKMEKYSDREGNHLELDGISMHTGWFD